MTESIGKVWRDLWHTLKGNLGPVFLIHLAYVALGFTLFTPLLGIVGKLLLRMSGKSVLSDFDIALFILSPPGLIALILFSSLLITILVFEQASLMALFAAKQQDIHFGILPVLSFTFIRVKRIFLYSIRLAARVLLIVLPFLVLAGFIAWLLLTDYDINYYLKEKPPVFLFAAAVIGAVLLTMAVVLVRKLLSWSISLPLLLLDDISPANSFAESRDLTLGHKPFLLQIFATWAVASVLLGVLLLGGIQFLGSKLAPPFFDSITILVFILGGLLLLWFLANTLVTTLTSGSFAGLLVLLCKKAGKSMSLSELEEKERGWQIKLTGPRFALILVACTGVAVLAGSFLLKGIKTDDDVMVIAHRGAAGKAPENTMASIHQAIEDGTDWIEIDVQESLDGKIVVIHDSDFMKLAGVDLKVWDATYEKMQEIDIGSWFAPEFSAERAPTLVQVLEAARGKAHVLIELKYYGHDQQLEQRVIDIVEQTDMIDDVAFMSLKYDGIKKLHALRPDWQTGLLLSASVGNLSSLDVDFLAINMAAANTGFIRRIHKAGKQLYVWTVNDQVSMSRVMSMGVDGIITDEPGMAKAVIAQRADLGTVERLLINIAILVGKPIPAKVYRDQSP
ncbi:MAG: glycerophosphodiester phosphodiesterase [Desulfobulbaceae bacterium]|nr:glycerophosphodiester phosphodiesterase [Desulfobulbaceae bacterium]